MNINNKNKTIQDLLNRTCCRQFTDKIVPTDLINTILKAGQSAPSAKNRQPLFFVIIRNKELQRKITQAAFLSRQNQFKNLEEKTAKQMIEGKAFNTSNDTLITQANFIILVLRNSDQNYQEGNQQILDLKEEQSIACPCTNMLNAAYALGIGMYWNCSVLNFQEQLLKILKKRNVSLPVNAQPRVILPGGYPKRETVKPKRKKLAEISTWIDQT